MPAEAEMPRWAHCRAEFKSTRPRAVVIDEVRQPSISRCDRAAERCRIADEGNLIAEAVLEVSRFQAHALAPEKLLNAYIEAARTLRPQRWIADEKLVGAESFDQRRLFDAF